MITDKYFLELEAKHGRKVMLEEMARAGIERGVETDFEESDADTIYDDCYTAAFDYMVDNGVPLGEARIVADEEAAKYAQQ